jgi:hypothetical protein
MLGRPPVLSYASYALDNNFMAEAVRQAQIIDARTRPDFSKSRRS